MKFRVTFKDPDGVTDALCDAGLVDRSGYTDEDQGELVSERLEKFIRYGEYITIEFDIDSGTATVIPVNEEK